MLERISNDLTLLLVSEKRCFKIDNSSRLSEGFDGQEKEMTDTCTTLFSGNIADNGQTVKFFLSSNIKKD